MSDDMFYARVCAERDQLRAELAAAKDRGDGLYLGLRQTLEALGGVAQPGVSEAFLILGVPGEAAAIKQLNVALAAHVERLRQALEQIADEPENCGCRPICQCRNPESRAIELEVKKEVAKSALAATPAQSLAAHDAEVKVAVLREVAEKLSGSGHEANDYYRQWLLAEADRIEKGKHAK